MLKNLSFTTKFMGGLIIAVVIVMIIMISIAGNSTTTQPVRYINDNASADNKVEALKTVTADLLVVENQNKALQTEVNVLQLHNKSAEAELKKSVTAKVQDALQKIQAQNQQTQLRIEKQWMQKNQENLQTYPVNTPINIPEKFIWVSDLSKAAEKNNDTSGLLNQSMNNLTSPLVQQTTLSFVGAIHKKNTIKPIYTIPVNATLTGATLMTPLVGRIPIDGSLPSPYQFKLVLSAKNLTANRFPMPGVRGAVLSGIASGDMLGDCARGDIHSITFVFNDGTISTTESKGDNTSLGYLSSQTGDPCIAGTFHSNATIFLGAQMGLAGAAGYANALSQAQYLNSTTPEGGSIRALIGNANEAAFGQGGSAATQVAQTWWNQRVQNSFDYVYVSKSM